MSTWKEALHRERNLNLSKEALHRERNLILRKDALHRERNRQEALHRERNLLRITMTTGGKLQVNHQLLRERPIERQQSMQKPSSSWTPSSGLLKDICLMIWSLDQWLGQCPQAILGCTTSQVSFVPGTLQAISKRTLVERRSST